MIGNLIAVVGQSNGQNYGTLGLPFPGGWTSDAGIMIYNGTSFVTYAPGTNSNGINSIAAWGYEAEYCRLRRLQDPGIPLYIFKDCVGGCGLAAKPAGTIDYSPYTTGTGKEWERMFSGLVGALNALNGLNKLAVIDTIIASVGEEATKTSTDAASFQRDLSMLLTSIRARTQCHNARAVIPRCFPNSTQGSYLTDVREAQMMVGTFYRNSWIDQDDLTVTTTPNDGHLVPASVVTAGARVFAADMAISP
jgi:hypothetical protein